MINFIVKKIRSQPQSISNLIKQTILNKQKKILLKIENFTECKLD